MTVRSSSDTPQGRATDSGGGWRLAQRRRRRLVALTLGISVVALLGTACTTPENRYRLLSIFFDGVPVPNAAVDVPSESVNAVEVATLPVAPARPELRKHGPYSPGQCDLCHVSQSSNRLVRPVPALCVNCHESDTPPDAILHGPVAAGDCLACHEPHRSRYSPLLVLASDSLCQSCHDDTTFSGHADPTADKGADCARCHDPHASSLPSLVRPTLASDAR